MIENFRGICTGVFRGNFHDYCHLHKFSNQSKAFQNIVWILRFMSIKMNKD